MRLNVGCGDHYADGWTNLDVVSTDTVCPDLVGSLEDLPPAVQDVTAVYLGHVLEHLPYRTAARALTALWARCRPGAAVAMVGPDCDRARALYDNGRLSAAELEGAVHGAGRWPGDAHEWECTEHHLLALAQWSGLTAARAVLLDDPRLDDFPVVSRAPWQCAVVGLVDPLRDVHVR